MFCSEGEGRRRELVIFEVKVIKFLLPVPIGFEGPHDVNAGVKGNIFL